MEVNEGKLRESGEEVSMQNHPRVGVERGAT